MNTIFQVEDTEIPGQGMPNYRFAFQKFVDFLLGLMEGLCFMHMMGCDT